MKLPVVWIVAALAAGIGLAGPQPAVAVVWLALAAGAVVAGLGLLRLRREQAAWLVGLLAWVFLGAAASRLEQTAKPAHHVTSLLTEARLDTSEPLRWRGRLRQDPVRLPWGLRYDVDLDEVEVAGKAVRVSGGFRASYFRSERASGSSQEALPVLRAGDRVEALLRARSPRNFGNPDAFDFRAYLARQDIHLTGSLRSADPSGCPGAFAMTWISTKSRSPARPCASRADCAPAISAASAPPALRKKRSLSCAPGTASRR